MGLKEFEVHGSITVVQNPCEEKALFTLAHLEAAVITSYMLTCSLKDPQ